MPCLPQHDTNPHRAAEVAEVRSRYAWDPDYLPPFPFLHIPDIEHTGPLHLLEILKGSFARIPVEEQARTDWLVNKTLGAGPAIFELLRRVPDDEWDEVKAAIGPKVALKSGRWMLSLWEAIGGALPGDGPADPDAIAQAATDALVGIIGEMAVAIDENQGIAATLLDLVDDLLHGEDEVDADSAREAAAKARAAGLPESLVQTLVPLQALLRLTARMARATDVVPTDRSQVLKVLPDPGLPDPTADDSVFGDLPVAGPNPVLLRRVRSLDDLPDAFPVTDAHLAVVAGAGATLADAIDQDRLFLVDHHLLADLPCRSGADMDFFGIDLDESTAQQRYLPAPFALFWRAGDGDASQLLPAAIQLGRDPAEFEIFTPADGAETWGKAMMLYLTGEFNTHEMATHLSGVHFALEGFAVAARRTLHKHHPITRLFDVHLDLVLWNNFLGRQTLTNPRGFTEQLLPGELDAGSHEIMRRHYAQWSVDDLDLPTELASRGVLSTDALPNYPFRDDGLPIWEALLRFIDGYLRIWYQTPEDFAQDAELAAFIAELQSDEGAHVPGLQAPADVAALARLLTGICFRAGPYHAAVNYGQYEHFSDPERVPGAPTADPRLVRELPREAYLTSGETALTQAGVMYVLTALKGDTLTDLDLGHYEDPRAWPLVAKLRQELFDIEQAIDARNAARRPERPYTYLKPSNVPCASNV